MTIRGRHPASGEVTVYLSTTWILSDPVIPAESSVEPYAALEGDAFDVCICCHPYIIARLGCVQAVLHLVERRIPGAAIESRAGGIALHVDDRSQCARAHHEQDSRR